MSANLTFVCNSHQFQCIHVRESGSVKLSTWHFRRLHNKHCTIYVENWDGRETEKASERTNERAKNEMKIENRKLQINLRCVV